jgi:hypothetical protein
MAPVRLVECVRDCDQYFWLLWGRQFWRQPPFQGGYPGKFTSVGGNANAPP